MNGNRLFAKATLLLALLFGGALVPALAQGNGNNECDAPGEAPDVIVGSLSGITRHGVSGGITAFSIGTTSCNVGSCWLDWFSNSNAHPVIGQNLFRLKNGRFEHVGQSWLKHGFTALSQNLCSGGGCLSTSGTHLGVNCSDPYSSGLNGQQTRLGPKFEVNAHSGFFNWPYTDQGVTGNAIYKRLQVHNTDLDPGQNAGALYWVEGQYVTADDAAADNHHNNASYRKVVVTGSAGSGTYDLSYDGSTVRELPAILVWADLDPGVDLTAVPVSSDGRFWVGARATDQGGGVWHYEYAVHNLNSHRSAMSFEVPIPAGVTVSGIGFHDVDYHSGEPYSGTDWNVEIDNTSNPNVVRWSTESFAENENANALRWGTLYNFRFQVNAPPVSSDLTIGLFRPGIPSAVTFASTGPEAAGTTCPNGTCDAGENPCNCSDDCGAQTSFEIDCTDGIDDDCDNLTDCQDADCCPESQCQGADNDGDAWDICEDCDDTLGQAWATPGEPYGLTLISLGAGATRMVWSEPLDPGGNLNEYRVLRSSDPSDFTSATCMADDDPFNLKLTELDSPATGELWCYLVRAINTCPDGVGSLGESSLGQPRAGIGCP